MCFAPEIHCIAAFLMRVRVIVMMPARAVMVVRVTVDHFRRRRRAAAVYRGAVRHFQLDRRVVDAEVIAQLVVETVEHAFSVSQRHLDDLDVAR